MNKINGKLLIEVLRAIFNDIHNMKKVLRQTRRLLLFIEYQLAGDRIKMNGHRVS